MTDEELRKEATFTVEWESTPMIDRPLFVLAYLRVSTGKQDGKNQRIGVETLATAKWRIFPQA